MRSLFRKKSTRTISEPVPDWDDTRWRAHLRANALGTEHHCGIYVNMTDDDRKEAARLFKNNDMIQARNYAESALRHKRTVNALSALSPLSNALYQRNEPLAGYTSLVQIPEPARAGIVTIIFAAGRLHMNYLSDTVVFLREQFGPKHINDIQAGEGELYALVNPTVRDALSPAPDSREDIEAELASAVRHYFGGAAPGVPRASTVPTSVGAGMPFKRRSETMDQSHELRHAMTTPLSGVSHLSSEGGAPISPQMSESSMRRDMKSVVGSTSRSAEIHRPPLPRSTGSMYSGTQAYHSGVANVVTETGIPPSAMNMRNSQGDIRSVPAGFSVGRNSPMFGGARGGRVSPASGVDKNEDLWETPVDQNGSHVEGDVGGSVDMVNESHEDRREMSRVVEHLKTYDDGDNALLERYDHLLEVLTSA